MKKQIAIDGPAASGKGTIARGLARALNFAYLDTGLLYRAVAQRLLQGAESRAVVVARSLVRADIQDLHDARVLEDLGLRHPAVSAKASEVAAESEVRSVLRGLQRDFADNPPADKAGAILDGRDIATVILPNAACKIFVTAAVVVRARRRLADLEAANFGGTESLPALEDLRADLQARDLRDETRADSPLRRDSGALLLDTGEQSVAESIAEALAYARDCLNLAD